MDIRMNTVLKHGEFTGLAPSYSRYRPCYCASVLSAVLALIDKPVAEIDAADVGAGTGIWTRALAARGLRTIVAVEPNDDMRQHGIQDSEATNIVWRQGSGEATGLANSSTDLLTMASSFHWVDFARGMEEFHRVLRPGGRFVALWNPRYLDDSPLFLEIEAKLNSLKPDIQRVSSGRSGITEQLTRKLWQLNGFSDVIYLEGRHQVEMTVEHYIGAWRSVNDVQVQLGAEKFRSFLDYVQEMLTGIEKMPVTYLTRAWAARRD
jgi:ubiquinone/menaquinone biosynthesis C-methylase UbiE